MSLADRVTQMEQAVGSGDWDAARPFLHPQIRYTVGGRPTVTGIAALRDYMEHQLTQVRWVGHEVRMVVETEDTAIIEVVSLFERRSDGAPLRLPCTDIYRFEDDLIADWRVYADLQVIGVSSGR
ncbi:nuclear transport factor 2 family protein [Gymnodinialimonas sp. 2305UL16-5]|uniref:nuclear transport factor 2 family protein n=1 Tax=Gymnodinialimonas mytili TaxID=3126503 RepID=UPI003099A4AA